MKKLLDFFKRFKSEIDYNRENQALVFVVLLFLEVFLMGFFCILPTYNSIKEKQLYLKDLNLKQEEMNKTLSVFKDYSSKQTELKPFVVNLYKKVPLGIESDRLFVTALEATALGGFSPSQINIDPSLDTQIYSHSVNIVSYKISATGQNIFIPDLIKSVESMSRLTVVKSFSLGSGNNSDFSVSLLLNSFYIPVSSEEVL